MKSIISSHLTIKTASLTAWAALASFTFAGAADWDAADTLDREAFPAASASRVAPEEGDGPSIVTSRPHDLPRLFTVPTAYPIKAYDLSFAGSGNVHSSMKQLSGDGDGTKAFQGSVILGLGGVAELGYRLDEYRTAGLVKDNIMMGSFKLTVLKERGLVPAMAVTAGKNINNSFHDTAGVGYQLDRNAFEVALSKSFTRGGYRFGLHPGVAYYDDKVSKVAGQKVSGKQFAKPGYAGQLGITWQNQPNTIFMYETRFLQPVNMVASTAESLDHGNALENNLGVRFYFRNWLCMDAGIRHFYDLDSGDKDMNLHANLTGAIPLGSLFSRAKNLAH